MDGHDRRFSSSSSSIPNKPPPSVLKGTDENEQNYQEMGSYVQNLSKPTSKHFMSPTISAASKANPPIKKILAERNESQDNPLQKTPNLDSKSLHKSTNLCSKSSSSSDFDENDKNAIVNDLSSNSLSPPRPKFLRYKPNSRQEILLRKENQVKEGTNGLDGPSENKEGINEVEVDLGSSRGSLAFCSKETDFNQEIEGIDEIDDEFEEVRSSGLIEVLKVLILFVVLVASTSYISSMNSSNPSPVVEAVVGLKDGYHMIEDHVYEFVMAGKVLLANANGKQMGFADVLVRFKKVDMIEDIKTGGVGKEEEYRVGLNEMEEVTSEERKDLEIVEDDLKGGSISDDLERKDGEVADEIAANSELEQLENEESKALEMVETEINEAGEIADPSDHEMEEIGEISDEVAANGELVVEGSESVEVLEMPVKIVSSDEEESLNTEIVENGSISHVKIENDVANDEAEEDTLKTGISKDLGTESIMQAVIGLSLFCSILASLMLGLYFFRKNRNTRKEANHPVLDSCNDSVLQDKSNSAIANANNEEEEFSSAIANGNEEEVKQIAHPVVSFENSKSSRPKPSRKEEEEEENFKPTLGSRAPTVELLGELEVGEMSSCTLRSCGTKKGIIESEVSSHSVSMEKSTKSNKNNSVPVHVHQAAALSEISNINFGSNSEKKKIVKKQQDEEEMKDMGVSTPLRRSSRIRSRLHD